MRLSTSSAELLDYCQSLFHRHLSLCQERPAGVLRLSLVDAPTLTPPAPPSASVVYQRRDIACTADGDLIRIELNGKGAFVIDRKTATVSGQISQALLADENLLDRLVVASLAFLLRERGIFPIHAFSAVWNGFALLLVGKSGSGKTTAGLALLQAGWGFLANDLALLSETVEGIDVLCCPQRIHVTAETASFFPELHALASPRPGKAGFRVEDIYPDALVDHAPARGLLFVQFSRDQPTQLRPISAQEALVALLPQSFAPWHRAQAAAHLALLGRLVETLPTCRLDLGASLDRLPALLADLVGEKPHK